MAGLPPADQDLSEISSINNSGSIQNVLTPPNKGLQRELLKYRLKYLFRQPCSVFCKSVLNRFLSGKEVYLILVMLALEQIAYSTASHYFIYPLIVQTVADDRYQVLINSLVLYIVTNLLFPVMGWIADAYMGRYNMIHCSLWSMWLGYICMTVTYAIYLIYYKAVIVLPLFYIIISFGHAGFQSCAIPYGADLIRYRTSQELSSYFYFYYWIRNFGLIFYVLFNSCDKVDYPVSAVICVLCGVICISLALILNACFRNWLQVGGERANPYKKVLQVLYLALVIKRPVHRSAFSFGGALPPSRINLTKKVHGGKFTNDEVEDVKTFLRLLLMLIFIFSFLTVYTGVVQAMPLQLYDMNSTILEIQMQAGLLGVCSFSENFILAFNIAILLLLIPLINSVLYPFLREYIPNMVKRIGIGAIFAVLAQLSMLIISGVGSRWREMDAHVPNQEQCAFSTNFTNKSSSMDYAYNPLSEYYVLIPLFLISLAELLINITCLEFFYAQSPHQMRGMMIGLSFFVWGVASGISQIMITVFGFKKSISFMTCDFWYYLLYLCVALMGAVGYIGVARTYKNRQRGQRDDVFYRQQYS